MSAPCPITRVPIASTPHPRSPRVSILLATYNGTAHIDEQIASLAAQENVAVAIILNDDVSTDNTVERAIQSAERRGVKLDVMPRTRKFGGAARNFYHLLCHANLADTEFVALCDQDDIWLPEKLSCATDLLQSSGADFYSCNSLAFWPDHREVHIRKDRPFRKYDYLFESASHGCTYVMTAEAARDMQLFLRAHRSAIDDIEFHDWLIYAWARRNSKQWVCDSRFLIRYRQSGSNALGANVGIHAALRRFKQLRTGWYRRQTLLIASVIGAQNETIVRRIARNSWYDRLVISLHANQCRRQPRDRLAFVVAALLY